MRSWMRAKSGWAAWIAAGVLVTMAGTAWAAEDDPWDVGSNWLSVRAGYARNGTAGAGSGGAGYGFGVTHRLKPSRPSLWSVAGFHPLGFMGSGDKEWITLFRDWSIGANVNHDVVSRFGTASEIDIAATAELVRHFKWRTEPRFYLGLGGGPYFRKAYHTGEDFTRVEVGTYLTTGMNLVVAPSHMLGFDLRYARLDGANDPPNPVFGPGDGTSSRWTFKLTYSLVN